MFIVSGAVCPHSFTTFTAMFTGVCVILRITLVNHVLSLWVLRCDQTFTVTSVERKKPANSFGKLFFRMLVCL